MQIPIPWGLIAIFISLSTFYYYNQKRKIKRQDRQEKLHEKSQELLEAMIKKRTNSQARLKEINGEDTTGI